MSTPVRTTYSKETHCIVCLEDVNTRSKYETLCCKSVFHKDCMNRVRKIHKNRCICKKQEYKRINGELVEQ